MSNQFHANTTTIPFQFLYELISDSSPTSVASLKQYWKNRIKNNGDDLHAMDEQGNTLLHLLASQGNATAIYELLGDQLLTAQQLRVGNRAGDTPLHQAARFGKKAVAEVLIIHDKKLCSALNTWGETPAYIAAAYGWEEMFCFLKGKSDHDVMLLGRKDGWTILHALVMAEHYDFAVKVIEEYPELVDRCDNEGITALHILASKPTTFRSGSQYTLINLGLGTFIPQQLIAILIYSCAPSGAPSVKWDVKSYGDVENPSSSNSSATPLFSSFLSKLSSVHEKIFTACPAIKEISENKKKHAYAILLAEKLLEKMKEWSLPYKFEYKNSLEGSAAEVKIRSRKINTNYIPSGLVRNEIFEQVEERVPLEAAAYGNEKKKRVMEMVSEERESVEVYDYIVKKNPSENKRVPLNPLIEVTRNGIIELVRLIVENFPHVANATVDEDGKNVLHIASENKNIYLYEYLNKSPYVQWDMLRLAVDRFGNTIWHHAANNEKGPKRLFGPGNYMTWDMFWFKFVKRDCDPYLQEHRNSNGLTAMELYIENHKSLRLEATKEAKEMNQGLMLVSTLIGTVNYSALITIPGGYNQDNGKPIFSQSGRLISKDLLVFMAYVAGALLASMFALGAQLAIQLSRFQHTDFFFSLSFKYLLAMTSLFYATNFTILACVQVFVLQGILKARWYTFFWIPCVCAVLVYIDALYLTFNYMYFLFLFFCTSKQKRQRSNRCISKYLY